MPRDTATNQNRPDDILAGLGGISNGGLRSSQSGRRILFGGWRHLAYFVAYKLRFGYDKIVKKPTHESPW